MPAASGKLIGDFAPCAGPRRMDRRSARDAAASSSYNLKARRRFKCAACSNQFSATSGTIFASHKLSFVDLLGAICLFVNASKGLSAVQLSRDLDVQYKTAFVLMHKLREAMAHETGRGTACWRGRDRRRLFWWSCPSHQRPGRIVSIAGF